MTRVTAPARLHFGLFSVPTPGGDPDARQYGGVGLMIESPRVDLLVSPAASWSAQGPMSTRALAFAQQFTATLPPERQRPFRIKIAEVPEEHAGLGSGTALALAVSQAIAHEIGITLPTIDLAQRVGRGLRSAVGIHGFEQGGLIVEAGKRPGEPISPLSARHEVPPSWRIVLVQPEMAARWHGERERSAFSRVQHSNASEKMWRIVREEMLPALATQDPDPFGEAVHVFNALAGAAFAQEQGGAYASPAIAAIIHTLREFGIQGVGQSSWGPTVFAIMGDEDQAAWLIKKVNAKASITRAAAYGAVQTA